MALKKTKAQILITTIFALLAGWWLAINLRSDVSTSEVKAFSDSIWLLSFTGGVYGLLAARKWGGFKSVFGKSISFFSLGLLSQGVGQLVYIFYDYVLGNENPYPSVADVFFFATIPLYIFALYNLAIALSVKFSKANILGKIATFIVPIAVLAVTYQNFLKGYERCFEDPDTLEIICSTPVTTFLDFAYPIGGAIYISIAVLIFVLSRQALGGIMRNKISILLLGLFIQYAAEVHYLYLTYHEELELGELNDLLYLTAYFVIAISIINLGSVIDKLLNVTTEVSDDKEQIKEGEA